MKIHTSFILSSDAIRSFSKIEIDGEMPSIAAFIDGAKSTSPRGGAVGGSSVNVASSSSEDASESGRHPAFTLVAIVADGSYRKFEKTVSEKAKRCVCSLNFNV